MAEAKSSSFKKHVSSLAIFGGPIVSFLLLGLVLNITSPLASGPVIILLVFVLFYLLVASALALIVRVVELMLRTLWPERPISLKKWYYVISTVALAPVLFVALNTLGQLGTLEISLIILLVALGSFYVVRRSGK